LEKPARERDSRVGDRILPVAKVKWFFMGDDLLKGSHIDVDSKDRVVTLNGTVKTETGRKQAVRLAQETDGVLKVVDNLKIQ
jgi:osmotically-inducible protein OsmY